MAVDLAWTLTVINILLALLIANGPGATAMTELKALFENETGLHIPQFGNPSIGAFKHASGEFIATATPGQNVAYEAKANILSAHIVAYVQNDQ